MGKLSPSLVYFTFSINTASATDIQWASLEPETMTTIAPNPIRNAPKRGRGEEGGADPEHFHAPHPALASSTAAALRDVKGCIVLSNLTTRNRGWCRKLLPVSHRPPVGQQADPLPPR